MVKTLHPVEFKPQDEQRIALLEIEHLTFGYTTQALLSKVQMSIHHGEMVGLLGPNGSGKTTLLRLISGVLSPQSGQILLHGRKLSSWGRRGIAQQIAVVPQELQVPFAFTVEQMVALGRTPFINAFGSRTKRDQEIVREALHLAEVDRLSERIFNEMSGGERQRVLLAMALAQQPRLLLLDEPTSHLDIKYQIEMLELVQRLNRETGVTVIAAMHDLNLAARYFPRLLLFQRGIVADGGPAEVLEPHLLQRVYDVAVQVGVMRGAEHLSVLPSTESNQSKKDGREQSHVHVMAGGGSGALVMRALADERVPFSTGVLTIGDSDHALALRLASEVIAEQPFAPISDAASQQLRSCLQQISFLIVCVMPPGPGNVLLLKEALLVRQRGIAVCLLLPTSDAVVTDLSDLTALLQTSECDYTGGQGMLLLRQLLEAGASLATGVDKILELVRQLQL